MFRKFIPVAVIAMLAMPLGGCTTVGDVQSSFQKAWSVASNLFNEVVDAFVMTRAGLQRTCDKIPEIEARVINAAVAAGINPMSCKARNAVVRERKAAEAICANAEKLGDRIPLNYYTSVRAGLQRARSAVASGC